jgi:hypothetical protein
VLARLLSGLVEGDLPAPSWTPLAIGTVTGLTALIGFALPRSLNSGTPRPRATMSMATSRIAEPNIRTYVWSDLGYRSADLMFGLESRYRQRKR